MIISDEGYVLRSMDPGYFLSKSSDGIELTKSLIQKNTSDKRIKFITRQDQLNGLDMSKYSDLDFYVLNSSVISGEESKLEDNPESEQEKSCEEDLTAEEKYISFNLWYNTVKMCDCGKIFGKNMGSYIRQTFAIKKLMEIIEK